MPALGLFLAVVNDDRCPAVVSAALVLALALAPIAAAAVAIFATLGALAPTHL